MSVARNAPTAFTKCKRAFSKCSTGSDLMHKFAAHATELAALLLIFVHLLKHQMPINFKLNQTCGTENFVCNKEGSSVLI